MSLQDPKPELSRPFDAVNMRGREMDIDVEAKAEECAALASRFGIVGIDRLAAHLTVHEVKPGRAYRVRGTLEADVTQACVVSLEPVLQHVSEQLDCLFAADDGADGDEVLVDAEAEDIEPLAEGRIDLGELVAQQLALGLDPFPRAQGVALDAGAGGQGDAADGPFAALAQLKGNVKQ